MGQIYLGEIMNIADQLEAVTRMLQNADAETKSAFAKCFEAARILGDKGFTIEQVQVIALMGQQCSQNEELKGMFEYLQTLTAFDPSAGFN